MTCYLIEWGEIEIGFVAFIPMVNSTGKNRYRIARLVILPEFQGLGISSKILNVFGAMYKSKNIEVTIRTIHPVIGYFLENSEKWKALSTNKKTISKDGSLTNNIGNVKKHNINYLGRSAFSYKYIGEKDEDNFIVKMNKGSYKNISHNQISFF